VSGWAKGDPFTVRLMSGAWVPYSAEMAVDLLDWPVGQVREVFGDTVLVRQTFGGLEFGRPEPAPDSVEVRDEVTEIIEQGIISAREQHRMFGGPPRPPDPDQLRRDLIAARDWDGSYSS
jgi:hypothetical protein